MGTDAPLGPEDITRRRFPTVFRGLDPNEVRAFLAQVAEELAWTRSREEDLRQQLAAAQAAPPPPLDEETLMAALGEETARIVRTAQQAAADIKAKAEENVTRILREAHDEAEEVRARAEALLARQQEDTAAAAEEARRSADAHAQSVLQDAAWRSQQLVQEAETTRDRILQDLAERRRVAHLQVERLEAGRARLLEAYEIVRRTLEEATLELERVEHEAPAAAEAVARRVELADPPPPPSPPVEIPPPPALEEPQPEPVAAPDPEPAAEPEVVLDVVEPTPEMESVRIIGAVSTREEEPVPAGAADAPEEEEVHAEPSDVFARIRAGRAEAVAQAREVLAEPAPEPTPEPVSEVVASTPDDVVPVEEPAGGEGSALATRDAVLEPLRSVLARKLKRALQDEQNDVLDRLRLHRRMPSLEELLPGEESQLDRYRAAAAETLGEAARSGAELGGGAGVAVDMDGVATALGLDIVAAVRRRLGRAIEESLGNPDPGVLADGVSAAYREWKSQRVERLAADHLAAAYTLGLYSAVPAAAPLVWLVDDADGPCPDCDDNTLAGPTPRGEAYPTGQLHPPAHAGCRCLLVPAPA